jgi:hypothetical protein
MANKKTASKTKAKTKKVSAKKVTTKKTVAKTAINKTAKISSKDQVFDSLRKWNLVAAGLLVIQGLVILIISKSTTVPVHLSFLGKDALASQAEGHTVYAPAWRHLFDVHLASLVAAFMLVAAFIFGLVATTKRKQYEAGLNAKTNNWRWTQFGFTAGLMLVTIALVNGVYDLASLIMIFALVCGIHLLGYVVESIASDDRTKWRLFYALAATGTVVWLTIDLYLKGALMYGDGLPTYVYWINGSIFVLTLALAFNKFMLIKGRGRWSNYLFRERVFIILTLTGSSALAWQIFFGSLRP